MENSEHEHAMFLKNYLYSHVSFEGISNSHWHLGSCLVFGYHIMNPDKIKMVDVGPLMLKSLDKLTDRDLIHIGTISSYHSGEVIIERRESEVWLTCDESIKVVIGIHPSNFFFKRRTISSGFPDPFDGNEVIEVFDYLRDKGFAIPWNCMQVSDMVDVNWIKLI